MTDASSPRAFVSNGPYRFIRHPNYLVVILEIFSLPLLGGAIFSSLIFSAINAGVLFFRIRLEERHLRDVPGYWSVMGNHVG
jgi:methyltransferase